MARRDGRIQPGEVGAVVPMIEDQMAWHWTNDGNAENIYDDLSGELLDPVLVKAARARKGRHGPREEDAGETRVEEQTDMVTV